MRDEDVPAWWGALGLPGLVDIHVHFLPERVMAAVWRFFDEARERYGVSWPVTYRTSDAERTATLRALGVRIYPALVYPHEPGMAESLNAWARKFAAGTPGCVAERDVLPRTVRRPVRPRGAGGRHPDLQGARPGRRIRPGRPPAGRVWGLLADAATPVVVHCGNGPIPGRYTGPEPMQAVLRRHPQLTAVIAHCGMPEYAEHIALAERYPNVHLDTTMVGTPFTEALMPFDRGLLPRLAALRDRVVLGSDFPNIPYRYAEQLAALERFDLGDDWLRAVCWRNGQRLLG